MTNICDWCGKPFEKKPHNKLRHSECAYPYYVFHKKLKRKKQNIERNGGVWFPPGRKRKDGTRVARDKDEFDKQHQINGVSVFDSSKAKKKVLPKAQEYDDKKCYTTPSYTPVPEQMKLLRGIL